MASRGGPLGMAAVVVVVVVVVMAAATAAQQRGPGDRATRMKNLRRSNTDLKALREEYLAMYEEGVPCTPMEPDPTDPPLPTVPKSFMTQVEILLTKDTFKREYHGVEMYNSAKRRGVNDYDLGAGVMASRPELLREEIHYDENIDEALFLLTQDPCIITGEEGCDAQRTCLAGTITDMSAELQTLFGNVDTGSGEMFMGAMGLMQFGPYFNYTYQGIQPCRGARCQVFQSCIRQPGQEDGGLLYTYYWTADDWDVENNGNSIPMIVKIVDTREGGMTSYVEFFDFRREWMPALDELEVPPDVFCVGRHTYISQPKPVDYFSYKSEQVAGVNALVPDGDGQSESVHLRIMFPQKEWYDYERRVSRRDFIPYFIQGASRRFENYTQEVLEFNQGLMYKTYPRLSTCIIRPIESNLSWGDIQVGPDGSVEMKNPWNWESLSEPMQYNGKHWVRGMTADVWVGIKENTVLNMNETVVWYFASPFTDDILSRSSRANFTLPTVDKVPIKFEKYLSWAEGYPHVIYNLYNYEGIIPLTHNHDVSLCFAPDQMRHFVFDLPQKAIERSLHLRENLKYAIQGALQEAGSVSPVRINRIELKQTDTAVKVTFTILEKASKVADVVGDEGENTMDQAVDAIRSIIDESQLIILVRYGNKPEEGLRKNVLIVSMTAHPNTMVEVERSPEIPVGNEVLTGYSSGDMAGLAVGMIILGALMGYGGMFLYGKKR